MTNKQTNLYNFKPLYLMLFYAVFYAAVTYINGHYLVNSAMYYNSLGGQMSVEQIGTMLDFAHKWEWLSYTLCPFIIPLKALIITACIYTATALGRDRIAFVDIFKVVLVAELIFLVADVIKIGWFLLHRAETLQEMQYFYPLSLLFFFKPGSVPSWSIYALQLVNLFEVAYWLALAFGLRILLSRSFGHSFKLVSASYGLGLCLWLVALVFIQLQMS